MRMGTIDLLRLSSEISENGRAYRQANYSSARSGENEAQKNEPGEKNKKKLLFPAFPQTFFVFKRKEGLVVFRAHLHSQTTCKGQIIPRKAA